MDADKTNSQLCIIKQSNKQRYEKGNVVDSYMKEKYHYTRAKLAMSLLQKRVHKAFPKLHRQEIKILEIAGAGGKVAECLQRKGYDVLLTDVDKEALDEAKKQNENLNCMVLDATKIFSIGENSFHAIYAGEIIEHLFDTRLFLDECYRCLKNNGVLVLTTPNLATVQDRITFLFGKSPRQVNANHEYLYLHIRPFTYNKLKEILCERCFNNVQLVTNVIRIRTKKRNFDFWSLAKIFPSLGGSLIVGAQAMKKDKKSTYDMPPVK